MRSRLVRVNLTLHAITSKLSRWKVAEYRSPSWCGGMKRFASHLCRLHIYIDPFFLPGKRTVDFTESQSLFGLSIKPLCKRTCAGVREAQEEDSLWDRKSPQAIPVSKSCSVTQKVCQQSRLGLVLKAVESLSQNSVPIWISGKRRFPAERCCH